MIEPKRKLGELFHHETLRWTIVGAVGKAITEWGVWLAVTTVAVTGAAMLPIEIGLEWSPLGDPNWMAISGGSLALWARIGCWSTPEPSESEI